MGAKKGCDQRTPLFLNYGKVLFANANRRTSGALVVFNFAVC